VASCWRINTARLHSVLQPPGTRSGELSRVLGDLAEQVRLAPPGGA